MAGDSESDGDTDVSPITITHKGPISKLCCDFYDVTMIEEARQSLLSCVALPDNDKRAKRRRSNAKNVQMNDIISILHEIQPEEMPEFLTKNLNNVPPMNVDNFDMSRIIKDMQSMQTQLRILQEAQETSTAVHAAICREPAPNVQKAGNAVQTPKQSTVQGQQLVQLATPPEESHTKHPITINDNEEHQTEDTGANGTEKDDDNVEDLLRLAQIQGRLKEKPVNHHRTGNEAPPSPTNSMVSDSSYSAAVRRHPPSNPSNRTGYKKPRYDADMRQSRRQPTTSRESTDDVITGTGHDTGLSAIPRSTRREKKYIGLFVSQLSPKTRAGSIVSHVYNKTGMIVKCAPHPTRYDSYSSYCVHATPRQTNILMNPELWPAGSIVKPFWKYI